MQRVESLGKSVRRTARNIGRNIVNIHGFFTVQQNNHTPPASNNALQITVPNTSVSKLEDGFLSISNSNNDVRKNLLDDAHKLHNKIQAFHLETLLGIEKLIIENEPTTAVGQLQSHAVFLEANREEVANINHVLSGMYPDHNDVDLLLAKCHDRLSAIKQDCENEHGLYEELYLNDNTGSGFDNWSHAESETASEVDNKLEKTSASTPRYF